MWLWVSLNHQVQSKPKKKKKKTKYIIILWEIYNHNISLCMAWGLTNHMDQLVYKHKGRKMIKNHLKNKKICGFQSVQLIKSLMVL